MATGPISAEEFARILELGIRGRMDQIRKEEIDRAMQAVGVEITRRIDEEMDRLALRMLKQYDISENRDHVLISVRKDIT